MVSKRVSLEYNVKEYKLINRKNIIKGIVFNTSKDLTLLINNPVDYLIDELLVLNNSKI